MLQVADPLRAHALPAWKVLAFSVAIAVLMSTEFLAQPFVWRNWPWDEVLLGWLEIARDRTVVALAIALALIAAARAPVHTLPGRCALLAAAICTGAAAGELALVAAGAPGATSEAGAVLSRVARWCVVAGSIAGISYIWQRTVAAQAAVQSLALRRAQLERQVTESRLAALRGQIEPHFLFNTLATVRRLRQVDPVQGARLLDHFVDYLRCAQLERHGEVHTLGQEIALTQAYLGVASARMAGRLEVKFDVGDDLSAQPFPPLTIATLVENAVKHGIAPSPSGGSIEVSVRRTGASVEAVVADTGVGFSGTSGSGIGLANIRERLQTLYGHAGSLSLQRNHPNGVRASMRVPCMPTGTGA